MENDDGYSDGNGTCRIEGCLKNICCAEQSIVPLPQQNQE